MEGAINDGSFSQYLIKPFSILEDFTIRSLSEKTYRIILLLAGVLILGYFLAQSFSIHLNITFTSFTLFLLSLAMCLVMNLLIDTTIGLTTLWFLDVEFIRSYYGIFNDFLSGRLIPLAFFPVSVIPIIRLLPFRYTLSFPVEIILGKLSFYELVIGFGLQFFWLILAFSFYKLISRVGIKNYQGFGA